MPSFINAYDAICQSCAKRFRIKERFTAVINMDIEGFEKAAFINESLNKTSCPFCKTAFTYEIPMIIFSLKQRFATLVMPNGYRSATNNLKPPYPILSEGFDFRIVRYQTEAREKYAIASYGLCDCAIEYIKLKSFSDEDAMPFDEHNIIFVSQNDNTYTFKQVDYNDNVIKMFDIVWDKDIPTYILNLANSHNKWLKIDRELLKEEI